MRFANKLICTITFLGPRPARFFCSKFRNTMEYKNVQKGADIFFCEICDQTYERKWLFDRHKLTLKHSENTKEYTKVQKSVSEPGDDKYVCDCGKTYRFHSGLWKHRKTCKTNEFISLDQGVVLELIKQNQEFKELLVEQHGQLVKSTAQTFNTTQHNTQNNMQFNLNFFLNETCGEAMDLMEFVKSITLSLEDLEETGRLGYANGVSRIFIRALEKLDMGKRPLHCNDLKRETIYIRRNNMWIKDDDKSGLIMAIKYLGSMHIKQIPLWQKENPDYSDPESKTNDTYMHMVCNIMSGSTVEEQQKNVEKAVRNVIREVVINKKEYLISRNYKEKDE